MSSTIGIDLGSRTTKIVRLKNNRIEYSTIFTTGPEPLAKIHPILSSLETDRIIATGYGRHLLNGNGADAIVTEIKACARGAGFLNPACRTVIDVGGQDSKVIRIDASGHFSDFEMNDRCAAGTGRFFEVMAHTLKIPLEEFGQCAVTAPESVKINSLCTVFAESEVVGLMTGGEPSHNIARGLHEAMIEQLMGLIVKVGVVPEVMFAGGVAQNPCIRHLLKAQLNVDLIIPEQPQLVVAIGAALIGQSNI